MLRIRLRRTGKAKQPSYRVVVADQRAPRDGAFVENLGHYNPRTDPTTFEVNEERVRHWLAQGAQPSETVHRLFHERGLIDREPPKHATHPSKAEARAEAEAVAKVEAEAKAKAEAEAAKAEAEAAAATASESESESESGDAGSSEGADDSAPSS